MAFDYMTVQYRSLQDRSVVITGGASGIGEEIVRAFAAQGARVSFIDIAQEPGNALASATEPPSTPATSPIFRRSARCSPGSRAIRAASTFS